MKVALHWSGLLIVMLGAGGCSGSLGLLGDDGYFRDRGDDYRRAEVAQTLRVPPQLSADNLGQLYVIPGGAGNSELAAEKFEVPLPNTVMATVEPQAQVRLQKLGERRWVAVSQSPAQVWSVAQSFLQGSGLGVDGSDPARGQLETNWLQDESQPSSRDRFLVVVKPGLRAGSAELAVTHLTASADAAAAGRYQWPTVSSNMDREAWLLRALSEYLANNPQAAMSVQSAQVPSAARSWIDSSPALVLQTDAEHAWASIDGALAELGFTVLQVERAAGEWQLEKAADEQQRSFWASGKAVPQRYRLQLRSQGAEQRLTAFDADGKALEEARARELLNQVYSHLL